MSKNATRQGANDRKNKQQGSGLSIKEKRAKKKAKRAQKWQERDAVSDSQPRS